MTTTVLHAGVTQTIDAARWNGSDIAFSPGDGPIPQLLLIGGGMYVQTSDGTWLHYANASDVGPKPLGGLEQLAQDNIAGTTPQQILALATGVQKTAQPDGTTVYTGTIPSSSLDPATGSRQRRHHEHDPRCPKTYRHDVRCREGKRPGQPAERSPAPDERRRRRPRQAGQRDLPRAGHGLTAVDGTYTWSVTYSQLGSTPPITPPPSSTDVPPGTLPPGMPPGTPQNTRTRNMPTRPITPADQADYLKAAACMRSHGVPDFPDPTFENNTVTFNIPPNIDPNSSQAKSAVATCAKLIPPGLPYSNRSAP